MSRRLTNLSADASTPALITFGLILGATALSLGFAVGGALRTGAGTPVATTDDEPGFDCRTQGNRVCGMEGPGTYPAPDGGTYTVAPGDWVYTGPMTWDNGDGSTVGVPGIVEDIADGCADQPHDLLDCVGAIIGQRMENQ